MTQRRKRFLHILDTVLSHANVTVNLSKEARRRERGQNRMSLEQMLKTR